MYGLLEWFEEYYFYIENNIDNIDNIKVSKKIMLKKKES